MQSVENEIITEPRVIALGGVLYRVVAFDQRTVLLDHYLMRMLRQTGADKMLPETDEAYDVFVVRMQTKIIDSGLAPELLAGYLIPNDMTELDWTPTIAKQTAKRIGRLQTPEDREAVYRLCVEVAFGFFKQGLELYARSLSSSQESPANSSQTQSADSVQDPSTTDNGAT